MIKKIGLLLITTILLMSLTKYSKENFSEDTFSENKIQDNTNTQASTGNSICAIYVIFDTFADVKDMISFTDYARKGKWFSSILSTPYPLSPTNNDYTHIIWYVPCSELPTPLSPKTNGTRVIDARKGKISLDEDEDPGIGPRYAVFPNSFF